MFHLTENVASITCGSTTSVENYRLDLQTIPEKARPPMMITSGIFPEIELYCTL